jgi:DNA-binding XRE family transcriptional regulator
MFETTDGRTLATERRNAGVTISTLARAVGVSRPTIYDWEANAELGEIHARRYLAALHTLVNAYPPKPESVAS